MEEWSFLTNHARAMLFIARDPVMRLRDLAVALDVTERTAFGIVVDLNEAGYIVKTKDGRRNRYHIQAHLPLRDAVPRERTVGEVVDLFIQPMQRASSRRPAATSSRAKHPSDSPKKPTRRQPGTM
jgi:DNA-binding IclR family transcriptional regulator